ncbi:MAG: Integrase catalytic region [Myxococcaceae bacterium]|nr:Integrase catalytic region [Myxococcaceae bacterium]
MLVKVEGKDTTNVVNAPAREVRKLPVQLRKSLTWDRGTELAQHKRFTVATDVQVYFCDPKSPWQRGTNENTNRLLRQYFPDGTSMAQYSQADLNQFARRLNLRPRKTLGFVSPADEGLHWASLSHTVLFGSEDRGGRRVVRALWHLDAHTFELDKDGHGSRNHHCDRPANDACERNVLAARPCGLALATDLT